MIVCPFDRRNSVLPISRFFLLGLRSWYPDPIQYLKLKRETGIERDREINIFLLWASTFTPILIQSNCAGIPVDFLVWLDIRYAVSSCPVVKIPNKNHRRMIYCQNFWPFQMHTLHWRIHTQCSWYANHSIAEIYVCSPAHNHWVGFFFVSYNSHVRSSLECALFARLSSPQALAAIVTKTKTQRERGREKNSERIHSETYITYIGVFMNFYSNTIMMNGYLFPSIKSDCGVSWYHMGTMNTPLARSHSNIFEWKQQ